MAVSFYNKDTGSWQKEPTQGSGVTSVTNKGQATVKYDSSGNKKSSQRYKPQTESTLRQLESGEMKSSGDVYIVGGDVAASEKTAIAVAEYKNQQRQDIINKQQTRQRNTQVDYYQRNIKQNWPYTPSLNPLYTPTNVQPHISQGSTPVPTIRYGMVQDPNTGKISGGKITGTSYYSVATPTNVSYLKPSESAAVYGSRMDKANAYVSEKYIKKPQKELYAGVYKPMVSKYIDYATFGDKPYAAQLKQTAEYSGKAISVQLNPDIYQRTYGVGGTRAPVTFGDKASVMFGGAVLGAVRYPFDKPVSFAGSVALGAGVGVVGGGIASIGTKSAMVVKGLGIGAGTVYGGMKLGQVILEPSYAKKGMIIGETAGELTAFTGGSRLGKSILTSGKKYYYNNLASTKVQGSTTQYYSAVKGRVVQLTPKHTITTIKYKPTVSVTTISGMKQGQPFRMTGIQTRPGQFQNIYLSGKTGGQTFTGIVRGGKTAPITSTIKYFKGGKLTSKFTTKVPPSYLNVKQTGHIGVSKNTNNLGMTKRGTADISASEYSGKKNFKEGFWTRTVETFKGITGQKTNTVFISEPTTRTVGRKIQGYGDVKYKLLVDKAFPTKIKFAEGLKAPKDISKRIKMGNLVVNNEPKTQFSLRYQRGGQLSITQTNKPTSSGKYSYTKGIDPMFMNRLKAILVAPVTGIMATPSSIGRFKQPTTTISRSATKVKPIKPIFRMEAFNVHQNIKVPIKTPPTIFAPITTLGSRTSAPRTISQTSITNLRPSQIFQPTLITTPINKLQPSKIQITAPVQVTTPIQITTTRSINTLFPPIITPYQPPSPPPPPPPPVIIGGGMPFFWPSASYSYGKGAVRKTKKQPKAYTPSGFAAAFNIKGSSNSGGVLSGLGIRPIEISKTNKGDVNMGFFSRATEKVIGKRISKEWMDDYNTKMEADYQRRVKASARKNKR